MNRFVIGVYLSGLDRENRHIGLVLVLTVFRDFGGIRTLSLLFFAR